MQSDPKSLNASPDEYPADPEVGPVPGVQGVIEHDVDPNAWLAVDDSIIVGRVQTALGPLKIAAITEQELGELMRRARKLNPFTKQPEVDPILLRRWLICYSISKANNLTGPAELRPENPRFLKKLTGELTTIQKAVQELSGLNEDGSSKKQSPDDFLD